MPTPVGGFADKIGNRYEAQYLVWAAMDLLDGERQSLRWEGVGREFQGIEYRSRLADGVIEVVQCKSNHDKEWTISALSDKGVLTAIRTQLMDTNAGRFTLILAGRATDLHALVQRATASDSITTFEQSLSQPLGLAFARLLSQWGLSNSADDRDVARQLLSRTRVLEHCTPESLGSLAEKRCADLFEGPPATTRAAIREVLEENLGKEITADMLISLLRSDRYKVVPRDWGRLPDQVEAVQGLRDRFRSQLGRLLIRQRLISRSETETVLKAIFDPQGSKVILLHGGAGNGKSGVLYETVCRLADAGTCVIPLRLDNALPSGNLLRYSREILQLPDTPVRCAARLSPGRRSVVVIDQLDAVRWAGVHSTSAWDVTLELLETAIHCPDVSVVVACRTFDMKDDPNLRSWRSQQVAAGRIQEIEVKTLDSSVVESVLKDCGGTPPTSRQIALLRNPLMLSLWCDLTDRGVDLHGVAASSHLLTEHWRSVKRRLAEHHGVANQTAEQVVSEIVAWAEAQGRLDFPAQLVADQAVVEALASESYLDRLDHARFRVAHQRHLDHQIASAVLRETLKAKTSIAQWVLGTDQSLMRREQVRQVLALLRDGDSIAYAHGVEELLTAEGVREHIRDLVLGLLADFTPPLAEEVSLLLKLAGDSRWTRRVRHRTFTNPAWWRILIERGLLQQWLVNEESGHRRWAARVLSLFAEHDPQSVSDLLVALSRDGGLDPARRLYCLPFSAEHDTPTTAIWRFRAQRRGELHCEPFDVTQIVKGNPAAALRYALHLIRWELAHLARPRLMPNQPPKQFERFSRHRKGNNAALRAIATALPRETWQLVGSHLLRHLRRLGRQRQAMSKEDRRSAWHEPSRHLNAVMRMMLSTAAPALAITDSSWLWQQVEPFLVLRSRTAIKLSAEVIGTLSAPVPGAAVKWLTDDPRRLGFRGTRYDLHRYWHGRSVLRHVWDAAPEARRAILAAIAGFHDPYERANLRNRQDYVREGHADFCRNLVGLPQYLLLSAMPPELLDTHVRERLAQWDAKFCLNPKRLRRPRSARWFLSKADNWKPNHRGVRLLPARELIPLARVVRVPDSAWIEMATPAWTKRVANRWKDRGRLSFETPDRLTESAFRNAAKTNPARFVRLAQRLPPEAADHWFEVILDAASTTEPEKSVAVPEWKAASATDIERCLARIANRDDKHLAMTLARLVRARPDEAWSDSTIDRICTLAVSHVDPRPDEFAFRIGNGDVSCEHVVQTSINCTRGVAVEAVERLLWTKSEKRLQLIEAAKKAAVDPHPAVRVAAIGLAGPLLNDDAPLALSLLDAACGGPDLRVLHSHHLSHLLRYLWWRCDPQVERIVERMAFSGLDEVEETGAFFAAIISLRKDRMQGVFAQCRTGTIHQRIGVATALASLTDAAPDRHAAADQLPVFFNDPEPTVAGAAASIFRDHDVMRSPLGPELAVKFVTSEQFVRDPHDLILPLTEYAGDLVPFQTVLADIVKRATTDMSGLNGDLRRSGLAFADKASECILRVYERAQRPQQMTIRSWCLDQFDALVSRGDHSLERALAHLDADAY